MPRLPGVAGRVVGDRSAGDLLRPAGLRQLRPAGRSGSLDGRLLPRRAGRRPDGAGPRSLSHPRPELGRDAAHGVSRRPTVGCGLGHDREFARQHAVVDRRDRSATGPAAAGRHRDPRAARGRRHVGRPRVRGRRRRLLRTPPLPRRADAGVRPAILCQAGPEPAGLPHDERTHGVPRPRHAQGLGDPVAAGRGGPGVARAPHERAPRRGHPGAGRRHRRAHAARRVGDLRKSGHLAHAEEPDRYMAVLADFLARAEASRVRPDAGGGPRSAGPGRPTGRPGPA